MPPSACPSAPRADHSFRVDRADATWLQLTRRLQWIVRILYGSLLAVGAALAGAGVYGLIVAPASPVGWVVLAFGAFIIAVTIWYMLRWSRTWGQYCVEALLSSEGLTLTLRNGKRIVVAWSDPHLGLLMAATERNVGGEPERGVRLLANGRLLNIPLTVPGFERILADARSRTLEVKQRNLETGGMRLVLFEVRHAAGPPLPLDLVPGNPTLLLSRRT